VDRAIYDTALQLYKEQNYRKAARLFLEAADDGVLLENGMAYQGAGNAFMHLKRYHDATVVYEQALRDESYEKRGVLEHALANAYLKNGDLGKAITHFEAALNESTMYEPYKCYQGLAHAYFEQQAYEQAALAYKNAALDERNPNPGAALVNLGLCMMALDRPASAIDAYSAALGVEGYDKRGKALANLGMAYYANGDMRRAQRALEEAQVMHRYQLSPAAAETLKTLQGEAPSEPEEAPLEEKPEPVAEPVAEPVVEPAPTEPPAEEEEQLAQATGKIGPIEEVDSFYTSSEEEIAEQGKEEERRERGRWIWLKPLLIAAIVLVVLAGAVAVVFTTGMGVPSTSSTLSDLFSAYNTGASYEGYWTHDAQDITRQMSALPLPSHYTVDSTVYHGTSGTSQMTVTAGTATKLNFTVTFQRSGLGWKVSSITGNY